MTPEQEAAVNWLVTALKSKPTDPAPWGAVWWAKYKAKWTSPPGPKSIVTHIQLAYEVEKVVKDMIVQAGTGDGLSEDEVKALITATKLTP